MADPFPDLHLFLRSRYCPPRQGILRLCPQCYQAFSTHMVSPLRPLLHQRQLSHRFLFLSYSRVCILEYQSFRLEFGWMCKRDCRKLHPLPLHPYDRFQRTIAGNRHRHLKGTRNGELRLFRRRTCPLCKMVRRLRSNCSLRCLSLLSCHMARLPHSKVLRRLLNETSETEASLNPCPTYPHVPIQSSIYHANVHPIAQREDRGPPREKAPAQSMPSHVYTTYLHSIPLTLRSSPKSLLSHPLSHPHASSFSLCYCPLLRILLCIEERPRHWRYHSPLSSHLPSHHTLHAYCPVLPQYGRPH